MDKRRLGGSDLEITPVVFGAWAIGGFMWGGQDRGEALAAIRAGLDAGVNAVDTAPVYGFGLSEELVGEAIRGRRDDVVVMTKCGLRWDVEEGALRVEMPDEHGRMRRVFFNLKPGSLRRECEASLRRLGVERIDLYQVHWPDPDNPLEDGLEELVRLREEGKIRWIGVSNFTVPQLETARRVAGIVSHQPQYSLIERRVEADALPWCRQAGVGVVAYSPLGRGLLTGAVGPERRFAASDHRSDHPWFQPERRRKVAEALERVRPIAQRHDATLGQLAIAWVVGEPGVSAALVGARTAAQARENARAGALRLEAAERQAIRDAFSRL